MLEDLDHNSPDLLYYQCKLKMICFNFFIQRYLMFAKHFSAIDTAAHMLLVQAAICMHLEYFIRILFSYLSFFLW
jgi:hypothetical protein